MTKRFCCVEGERYEKHTQANGNDHPGTCIQQRFFIDHGVIHDRLTGKHVRTTPDDGYEDGITACCRLLNDLNHLTHDRR